MDSWLLPLCRASAMAYSLAVPWFQNTSKTCQVYKSIISDQIVYAFEGTKTWREWMIDFLALEVPFHNHPEAGPVHFGFWVDTIAAIDAIERDLLAAGRPSFVLTGHSKGGAEAVLAHVELKSRGLSARLTRCFEPPMIGTRKLSASLVGEDIAWTQSFNAHGKDIVTLVPDWPEWDHQGSLIPLAVPDGCGIAEKHEITTILTAAGGLV